MTAAWGDEGGDVEPEGESGPSEERCGPFVVHIDPVKIQAMLNSAIVKAAVDARGRRLAEEANNTSITEGAQYVYVASDNPDNTRARGRVMTANYKAQVDDAHHSTLLKTLASVGSDPKPDTHEGGQPEPEAHEDD